MAVEQASDLLTVREAAALLKVSTVTINRYLNQGRLRAYHVGSRAIRIKREDLDHLLTPAREQEVTAVLLEQGISFTPPSKEELARRKAVVEQILARRKERVITPMTAADLVRQARAKDTW